MLSLEKYRALTSHTPVICPSLLACDFSNLEREIRSLEDAGVGILHLDVMDGHFVPNLSIGIPIVESVRKITNMILDVHLMISNPESYVSPFRNAGADVLTFHVEAIADELIPGRNFARNGCKNPDISDKNLPVVQKISEILEKIRGLGAAAGLSIVPPTEVEVLAHWADLCDNVLIMSVMPGFGGQRFDASALEKLQWLRGHAPERLFRCVDGGVNEETLEACVSAGATGLIMGTAIFKNPDRRQQMKKLQNRINELSF